MSASIVLYFSGSLISAILQLTLFSIAYNVSAWTVGTVCETSEQVILNVGADTREVDLDFDAERLQDLGVTNTRQLEDLRRLDCSAEPSASLSCTYIEMRDTYPADRMTSPLPVIEAVCFVPSYKNSTPFATNPAPEAERMRATGAFVRILRFGREPAWSRYAYDKRA